MLKVRDLSDRRTQRIKNGPGFGSFGSNKSAVLLAEASSVSQKLIVLLGKYFLRMFDKIYVLGLLSLILSVGGLHAQSQDDSLDPAGFVNKYDTSFTGIGPKVYTLPAPRSKQEILVDSYEEKKGFFDSIARQLDFQELLDDFQFTSNASYLEKTFAPYPTTKEDWQQLLGQLEENRNLPLVAGLSNQYAYQVTKDRDFKQAIEILQSGLSAAQRAGSSDSRILEHNLAQAYVFSGEFQKAAAIQDAFLKRATETRATTDQGTALVRLALVQAYGEHYATAENTIIRRVFPIFNKNKNHRGKIHALITLAKIYQLQNKHTEAQWFLIQARDLGRARKIEQDLPEIEYMLAFSKLVQKNYSVAQTEFEQAKELAGQEDNKVLQLAISDKLGDIYLLLEDYQGAEQELEEYWQLRSELFPHKGGVN